MTRGTAQAADTRPWVQSPVTNKCRERERQRQRERIYYEQLYAIKSDSIGEVDQLLERYILPNTDRNTQLVYTYIY
jgi:hypothetical protein